MGSSMNLEPSELERVEHQRLFHYCQMLRPSSCRGDTGTGDAFLCPNQDAASVRERRNSSMRVSIEPNNVGNVSFTPLIRDC